MIIPPDYTPIQIIAPDDGKCGAILHIWQSIYYTNRDTYSYISHVSLAREYNLIYAIIRTDKLTYIKYPYTTVPLISAENIEFYKLNKYYHLILKEENHIQEIIAFDGTQIWYKNGELHRDNDLPAIIFNNGKRYWYKNGRLHRDNDLPAVILHNGTQEWYKDGERHRDNDLPSVIYPDGRQLWVKDGVRYDNPF